MPNAIAYLRVSTSGQVQTGASLEAQKEAIEGWCRINGYTLIDTYEDAGVSGKNVKGRPGFRMALDATCVQEGTALVVYSLSRAARSIRDLVQTVDRLQAAQCRFVSLTESFDLHTATGKLLLHVLGAISEFERDIARERTAAVLDMKRARGEVLGRIPYGYMRDGKHIEKCPREQRVISEIKEMREAGWELQRIAQELEDRQIPNRVGHCKWRLTSINNLLNREDIET